jgi:hypothetical protein
MILKEKFKGIKEFKLEYRKVLLWRNNKSILAFK